MRTGMAPGTKSRARIQREARHGGRNRRRIPWGANHQAPLQRERLKKLLPLREVVHVQQRSAVELTLGSRHSGGAIVVEQPPRGSASSRERALEDSPGGRLGAGLNTACLLREKPGLLMEHDRC
jgi:hypothetical protein